MAATAAFAIAFHREGSRHRATLEPLRPQGAVGGHDAPTARRLGRQATSPLEIAPRGWWQVLKRTAKKFSDNELMSEAASVTFYALLSLFPAVTAIVSIYGLFADRGTIEGQIDTISTVMPSGGVEIIREQVHRLTQTPASGLGIGLVFGLAVALWSANAGTKAMLSALNDVYGERESRGFVKVTLTSMAFTLGAMVFLLLAIAVTIVTAEDPGGDRPRQGGLRRRSQPAGPSPSPASSARWRCFTGSARAGGRRAGNGSPGAGCSAHWRGSACRSASPGTSPISAITTRPTVRSAR